ncbi:MAG: sugar porter family MFS transporter [Gammaproteobacteria bacterium]
MESVSTAKRYYFIFIAAIAAIAGILFGYDTGVVSGAILFINDEFILTPQTNGLVVSAVLFGALIGALFSGRLADHLGRKNLLLLDAIIFILGTLATALGSTISLIIIGRIIVGIAIGIASYVSPLYISEISPAKYRGALVSLNQLAVTLGILLSYIVDYYFAPQGEWRFMFAAGVVPAAAFFFGLLFLPDSPRFIAAKGQTEKALAVLTRIYLNPQQAQHELSAIQTTLQHQSGNWKQLFSPLIRSTLTIGIGLAILQQVTGINTIIYYAPTIFKLAGFESAASAILATMGVGVVFVLFTVIALPLIDTLGRRPLLLIGLAGMAVSLLALSFAFSYPTHSALLKWTAMSSMLLYIACFAFSLGPIMWLMIAEIYPLKVRGLGSSLATAANWGSNMFVAITFLTLIQFFGASGTFFIYSLISLVGIFFIYYLVPETKHVTLEQIEAHLQTGLSFRKLGAMHLVTQTDEG